MKANKRQKRIAKPRRWVTLRRVLQEKLAKRIAQGAKQISVDSLLFPADWQSEPLVGLFKGDVGKCSAGLILPQLLDESCVPYRAIWYNKPEDPRGHARLYVLGDEEAAQ